MFTDTKNASYNVICRIQTGTTQTGMAQTGMTLTGMTQTGMIQTGTMRPGTIQTDTMLLRVPQRTARAPVTTADVQMTVMDRKVKRWVVASATGHKNHKGASTK